MVAASVIQESDKFNFSIIVGRLKLEKSSATSFDDYFELIQRSRSSYPKQDLVCRATPYKLH